MTDKLLTAAQLDDFERRAANWLDVDEDIEAIFNADALIVDALRNMLPLAIAELRASRSISTAEREPCEQSAERLAAN